MAVSSLDLDFVRQQPTMGSAARLHSKFRVTCDCLGGVAGEPFARWPCTALSVSVWCNQRLE
ncbi:hypothetical protein Mapa_010382 [Marchantia paleacea]|nr:hypothetical protein Mapa_010382 [Marchantia paleacea]